MDKSKSIITAVACFLLLALLGCKFVENGAERQQLFNGKDLTGWEHVGDGSVVVEDGMLKTQGGMGLLWYTPQMLGNVKIRVVYKGAAKNNAGVFIRIPEKPTEAWMPVNKGYEVQIDDRGKTITTKQACFTR